MKLIMLIIVCLIFFILYYTFSRNNVQGMPVVEDEQMIDHSEIIKNELRKDKFVKPQHNLLYIFNQMSSLNKVVLNGDCQTNIYTKDTIPKNKSEYLVELMSIIMKHIKYIDNEQDYFMKDIDQVYYQVDKEGNKRYIVVSFIYDIRNYYTMKIVVDFVRKYDEDQLYVNSIGNEFSSNYNILNKYDYSIFSKGYLKNYNMFDKDARAILDENYKKYFTLVGVNNTSLDNTIYKINKLTFSKYDLDDYNKYYYPPGLPNVDSGPFCKKHLNDWAEDSVKFENPYIPGSCIVHNNASREQINRPYFAPGVVTQRTDENEYSWQVDPSRGNIIRSLGGLPN